jgi:hypothetical protein
MIYLPGGNDLLARLELFICQAGMIYRPGMIYQPGTNDLFARLE